MKKTRLDVFLSGQYPQYSRSKIKKLIEDGYVSISGNVVTKASLLLHGGEELRMARRAPEIPKAVAEEIPLEVLYEDDALLVINKAAGIVVHPAPGNYTGTLVSAVLNHWGGNLLESKEAPEEKDEDEDSDEESEVFRPGIVHRLDKGTSGVMVIAKNDQILKNLSDQFKARSVKKTYRALVFGIVKPKKGTISFAMGRDTIHRRKFSSRTKYAKEATTHFEVEKEWVGLSLLTLKPETGRTHQIRVHLSEKKHPIVGDTVYGAKAYLSSIKSPELAERLEAVDRPLLHAARLEFFHPTRQERVAFEAPLPADFADVLKSL